MPRPSLLSSTSSLEVAGYKRIWEWAELDEYETPRKKRSRVRDILRSPKGFHKDAIEPVPDKRFYFDDGDLTLIANDTVFKVHSVMLARDGSKFEFTLKDRHRNGGERVPRVFTLPEDSPRHFRQLLWALYAWAPEINFAMQPENVNVDKMLQISYASTKYGFLSYEKWALDVVCNFFRQLPEDGEQFMAQGQPRLLRVLQHAARTNHTVLRECISARWESLLLSGRVSPAQAMGFAEQGSLSSLRGFAYYNTLLKRRETWDADTSLTTQRRITLLSGFERLVVRWEELKETLLHLDSVSSTCNGCAGSTELAIWDTILHTGDIEKCQAADILGKLQTAQSTLGRIESDKPPSRCAECIGHASDILDHYMTDFRCRLSDFFSGVV